MVRPASTSEAGSGASSAMRTPARSVRRTSYSDGTSIVQIDNATAADVDRAVRAINGAESGRTGR